MKIRRGRRELEACDGVPGQSFSTPIAAGRKKLPVAAEPLDACVTELWDRQVVYLHSNPKKSSMVCNTSSWPVEKEYVG